MMGQQESNNYFDELAEYLTQISSKKEMESFLHAVLTPRELEELPKRLQIIRLLKGGTPQRIISEELGVGIATVTRGSRVVREGGFDSVKPRKVDK